MMIDIHNAHELFQTISEPYAAGLFEMPEASLFERFARAQRRFWEACELDVYHGGWLYPCGKKNVNAYAVNPDFSYTFSVDWTRLGQKSETACRFIEKIPAPSALPVVHTVGGAGYTHSIPHYERILSEGLDSYEARIRQMKIRSLRNGLLDVMSGIRTYHQKVLSALAGHGAKAELLNALQRVPFQPSRTLYEAIVCWNFIYYIDFCDNPGRLDAGLEKYWNGEDATEILHEFFQNVDVNDGWSGALGPDYGEITLQCLRAVYGLRRPSLELRTTPTMPDDVWNEAIASVFSGCGQPAFYNEFLYQEALKRCFPHAPEADRLRFCGGGCTETMIAGLSNIGSLDAGINLAWMFSNYLRSLPENQHSFSSFYTGWIDTARAQIKQVLAKVNDHRKTRAQCRPHPVRTLLIDDCIQAERDFNDGGARYNGSVVNIAGLINVIDSLLAIRFLVFETKNYSMKELVAELDEEKPALYVDLQKCPHYGVGNKKADELAADFTQKLLSVFDEETAYPEGPFMASSIQFATYVDAGRGVPATPDGRKNSDPLCDSIGPLQGRKPMGPTALLESASSLWQRGMPGTPILNLRVQKSYGAQALKALIQGYFDMGGMQLQISCLSREYMLEAMAYPEKHQDLIVRIGGYSEYFNRLTPALQQTVLERTEF
ncbi:MAG: pyruvate formate lyase family protein [Christensenellales bacterium]|jgi:hypothetical protein